jgi:glycosyltransferase involved in cell wall biosynthesis
LFVSGFTFIRNAVQFDFPIREAILSILPVCDEVIVAVGESEDQTLELIQSIAPEKIRIIQTKWDDSLRKGGRVLAVETDKALAHISKEADWAFYIQGDEVVHEQHLKTISDAMTRYKDDQGVDGLLFNYLHFYGSYDYIGSAQTWYPYEIRIIKNDPSIYSYKDAQGFRKGDNEKLRVKLIDAFVYHYGYVKDPQTMMKKVRTFVTLWRDDEEANSMLGNNEMFDFLSEIDVLNRFQGTHPKVMQERVQNQNWKFDYDLSFNKMPLRKKVKAFIQNYFGIYIGYKNYRKV